ncbi:MAG: hypothetical protein IT542_09920 [Rubellimicrobium sp.]|nr:hypothetical protein [Rubellimicrobium sp.]
MTNRLALILAILLGAALVADRIWFGGAGAFAAARRGVLLLDWLAFWR